MEKAASLKSTMIQRLNQQNFSLLELKCSPLDLWHKQSIVDIETPTNSYINFLAQNDAA